MKEVAIGQRFGKLTVAEKYTNESGNIMYHCDCECGKSIDVPERTIRIGRIISCGCARKAYMKAYHVAYKQKLEKSKENPTVILEKPSTNPFEIFTNENFGSLRIIVKNNEPWFVAKDVCDSLEIKNVARTCARLLVSEKGVHSVNTPGGDQKMTIVNESGLYALVMTSRLPKAKDFRYWITSEVLPSIRKTGSFSLPKTTVQRVKGGKQNLASVNRAVSYILKAGKLAKVSNQVLGETVFNVYRQFGLDLPGLPGLDKKLPEPSKQIALKEINPTPVKEEAPATKPVESPVPVKEVESVTMAAPQLIENLPTFLTCTEIAKQIGVYSVNNIPHSKLISAIIRHIKVPAAMSTMVPYRNMKSGYEGDAILYHPTVANMVKDYLSRHDCPPSIRIDNKFYTIFYKMAVGRRK